MNWSNIKNKLIIILLVLTISLAILYVFTYQSQKPYKISNETALKLESQLKDRGIDLNTELSDQTISLSPLIVKYQDKNPEQINESFFASNGEILRENDLTRVQLDYEEVTIINNRRIIYENLSPSTSSPNLSPEELVKNFMIDKDFYTGDMTLTKKIEKENGVFLEFVKTYNDNLIETSYTRFEIEDGIIRMMDRLWIDVIEEDNRLIEIEPSYKAVLSLMDQEEYYDKTINNVNVCYYFNPEEQGILEDNTQAVRGRAIPAWRISFNTGEVKVVDNY